MCISFPTQIFSKDKIWNFAKAIFLVLKWFEQVRYTQLSLLFTRKFPHTTPKTLNDASINEDNNWKLNFLFYVLTPYNAIVERFLTRLTLCACSFIHSSLVHNFIFRSFALIWVLLLSIVLNMIFARTNAVGLNFEDHWCIS